MGYLTLVFSAFALLLVVAYTDADRQCPPPSKVYSRTPKCKDNYDCKGGKLCCLNQSNEKSCFEPVSHGGVGKYGSGNNEGVRCEGLICQKGEVCELDPKTKRKRCVRK
ncbi:waprin-like protein [Cydia pomonella]|uniref:waprin-like protein n=1 Tax=Cydia pomonella TaxID=82600 RepID=UPI002ADD6767|nr:waprin-like protein [Cydia pomonella]